MALPRVAISETPCDSLCLESWIVPAWINALVVRSSLRGSRVPPTADEVKKWQGFYEQQIIRPLWRADGSPALEKAYYSAGIFLLHALPTLSDYRYLGGHAACTAHMMAKTQVWRLGTLIDEKIILQNGSTERVHKQLHRRISTFEALNGKKLIIDFDISPICKLENLPSEDKIRPSVLEIQCNISWDQVNGQTRRIAGKICDVLSIKSMGKLIHNKNVRTVFNFSLPDPDISPSFHEAGIEEAVPHARMAVILGGEKLFCQATDFYWVKAIVDT